MEFRSHLDGSKHLFTPESVVGIQRNLNSDIMMVLDECVPYGADYAYTEKSLALTTRWALRARAAYPQGSGQNLLFAITQGGFFKDLRKRSIEELCCHDFDGFAISAGDYLALTDGKLFGTDQKLETLLDQLAALAADKGAEFITVFYGDGVTQEDAQRAEQRFADACPEAEVSLLPGGQPVYYYIISIE